MEYVDRLPPDFNLQTSGVQATIAGLNFMKTGMKTRSTPYGDDRPPRKCYTCFDMDLRTGIPESEDDGIIVHHIDFQELMQANMQRFGKKDFCLSCGFLSGCLVTAVMSCGDRAAQEWSRTIRSVMLESS